MSQFDWRTEDDAVWREPPPLPAPSPKPGKRPWPILIFILAALLLAGWVVYRQVRQQIESATTAVQEDILSTHNLVQTAVYRQDLELFLSQLSGRDPAWTAAQEAVWRGGMMADRDFWGWQLPAQPPLLLTLADLSVEPGQIFLALSPDLNAAELQYPQEYVITTPAGLTTTVALAQTAVYRRGSQRWLLSPPDDDFWGGWVTSEGDMLKLIYPDRDAVVAEQLATDLETMLHELCRTYSALKCPNDLQVSLRLDSDASSLLTAADRTDLLAAGLALSLPAPTLLGVPQDQAGYEALYRAYGGQVATAVIAHLTGYQCCHHGPFFQVFNDYILSHIDLRPWPVTVEEYANVLRHNLTFEDLQEYWDNHDWRGWQPEESRHLYTAADFLLQIHPNVDPVAWLQNLEPARGLSSWLRRAFGDSSYFASDALMLSSLNEEWWQFAYTQTLLAQQQAPLPIPFPDQDLQLLCLPNRSYDENSNSILWRYDLPDGMWTEVLTRTRYNLIVPFLDDSGWLLQSFPYSSEEALHTEVWRDGRFSALPSNGLLFLSLGQTDPTGRYLVIYSGLENDETIPALIDLQHCDDQVCDLLAIVGSPIWSPDAQHTLVAEADLFQRSVYVLGSESIFFDFNVPEPVALYLGDRQAQVIAEAAVGAGYSPFWLDTTTFGYVRPAAEGSGSEVVLGQIDGRDQRVALTLDNFLQLVPDDIFAPAAILHVLTHPSHPDLLFVVATDALGRRTYLFSYDVAAESAALRFEFGGQPYFDIGFSPDGRWLSLATTSDANNDFDGDTRTLALYEIATGQTQTYTSQIALLFLSPRSDWSADGRWITFPVNERLAGLVAPEYGYQWVFAHERGYCVTQHWINKKTGP
ncbi:MAG: hypothetical protein IPM39_21500 [Chloroflexi bacterium]|nr:hypothetical protein [Chloroflexota bacterium]